MRKTSDSKEPSLSLALPITSHYSVNNRNLILFLESFKRGFNAIAYQYGKQFVETALFELPKHGYFGSSRHKKEREKTKIEAWQVTNILEAMLGENNKTSDGSGKKNCAKDGLDDSIILIDMDSNEKRKEKKEMRHLKDLIVEVYDSSAEEMLEHGNMEALLIPKREIEAESLKDGETLWSEWVEIWNENATNRLCSNFSSSDITDLCRPSMKTINDEPLSKPLYPFAGIKNLFQLPVSSNFCSHRDSTSENKTPKNDPHTTLSISSLTQCYKEDFQQLLNIGEVSINQLETFQGKKSPNGINGCTVIAPLIAIYHFMENSSVDSPPTRNTLDDTTSRNVGILPDATIEEIIDDQAPNILPIVRENLGITKDALIIPADVHDYLLEKSFLCQNQFVGVCGGNILDRDHLGQFLKLLNSDIASIEEGESKAKQGIRGTRKLLKKHAKSSSNRGSQAKQKKMAATLFFHEHVVCVLKNKRFKCEYNYEIIDSLPSIKTLGSFVNTKKSWSGSRLTGSSSPGHKLISSNTQHDTDAQVAKLIMIQQQRQQQEQVGQISLKNEIALAEGMDDDAASALVAAVTAEEAEQAIAAAAFVEDHTLWRDTSYAQIHNPDQTLAVIPDKDLTAGENMEEDHLVTTEMNAVRIKCNDIESLKATLHWYSCSRFTDEDKKYIDEYEWDDRNIDFDPRVFQAFIWTEL